MRTELGGRISITVLLVRGAPPVAPEAPGALAAFQEQQRQQAAQDAAAHELANHAKEQAGKLALLGLACAIGGLFFPPLELVAVVALEASEAYLVAGVGIDLAVAIDHPTQDNWVTVGGDAVAVVLGYVVGKVVVGRLMTAFSNKLAQRAAQKAAAEVEAAAAAEAEAAGAAAAAAAKKLATEQAAAAKALDNDGGHSYADHGAQTTAAQQANRLKTGEAPSGRKPVYPKGPKKGQPQIPAEASKFDSHAKHLEASQKANIELQANKLNPDGSLKKTVVVKVPVKDAGTSYSVDNAGQVITKTANSAKAVYRLDPATNTYKLVTMYPEP